MLVDKVLTSSCVVNISFDFSFNLLVSVSEKKTDVCIRNMKETST